MTALLEKLKGVRRNEQDKLLAEYRAIIDRADKPKNGDVERLHTVTAALGFSDLDVEKHVAARKAAREAVRLKREYDASVAAYNAVLAKYQTAQQRHGDATNDLRAAGMEHVRAQGQLFGAGQQLGDAKNEAGRFRDLNADILAELEK